MTTTKVSDQDRQKGLNPVLIKWYSIIVIGVAMHERNNFTYEIVHTFCCLTFSAVSRTLRLFGCHGSHGSLNLVQVCA